jgi:ribosomal protein S18 acetylase RimI-like enzyme
VIKKRALLASDRPLLQELLGSLEAFTASEREIAMELVDARLARPECDDYRFILAFFADELAGAERLAGYVCYGRTPMTHAAYDLYWIATRPDFARTGVARSLLTSMESEIQGAGGGIVRVETGSREGHGGALNFYEAMGFSRAATIADFYAPGDHLILFTRRIAEPRQNGKGGGEASAQNGHAAEPRADPTDNGSAPVATNELDEPALYDAAFGYRDYAKERDFLLACAAKFGARPVRRVLAWASGAGRHLEAFAELGISGVGADASENMVAYARRLFGAHPAARDVRFVRAGLDEPLDVEAVDLSFVPLSSIHQLTTEGALEAHLAVARDLLQPGGVHIIEATHPGDLTPAGVHHTEWTELRGDQIIDARFRMHIDRITAERCVPVTLEVGCATGKKGAPRGRLRQEDVWFIPDLPGWRRVIERTPGLVLSAALGDFHVDVPFEHAAAWRLILVLRREDDR